MLSGKVAARPGKYCARTCVAGASTGLPPEGEGKRVGYRCFRLVESGAAWAPSGTIWVAKRLVSPRQGTMPLYS